MDDNPYAAPAATPIDDSLKVKLDEARKLVAWPSLLLMLLAGIPAPLYAAGAATLSYAL